MYQSKEIGKDKFVGIAQTGIGWNVSTWTITSKNRVRTHASKNTRTLAEAKKEFTRQKRKFQKKPSKSKKPRKKPKAKKGATFGLDLRL